MIQPSNTTLIGHALGLEGHEWPFLNIGDKTELKPGKVFLYELGFCDMKVGGFGHSDTFVVTEYGIEILTKYQISKRII